MKQLLHKIFGAGGTDDTPAERANSIALATAILLVEVSKADFEQDDSELARIRQLLIEHLEISEPEVDALLAEAHKEADQLVSLQHLTRMMNEKLSQLAKVRVIELMWRVVFADGDKSHYEEHLLRQVADLLYVSHGDYIQARHRAEQEFA